MEKIYYDDTTYIWKTKLNRISDKSLFLKEAHSLIESMPHNPSDGYLYNKERNLNFNFIEGFKIETKLDELIQIGINSCKEIYNEKNINYNKINTSAWINVVRSNNPLQINFKHSEINGVDKYHTHTELQKNSDSFFPHYTYVYYIQMPNVMSGDDGVLYFKGKGDIEYYIKPEEDDLIIMEGNIPHSPNNAPQSTIDRIVLAGNVGFDSIKKEKTLI